MPFFNFNGTICTDDEPVFTADNRALRYGEGLIETMLWSDGRIRLFERHAHRLQQSLALLGIPPITSGQFENEIRKVISANEAAGPGKVRAQFFIAGTLQFMIEYEHLLPAAKESQNKGLKVGISRKVVRNADAYSALKTSSRLAYSMAALEAAQEGWDDAVLLNASGHAVESTICNIFCIRDKIIYTPPLSEGCVAGIMRGYLLDQHSLAGMLLQERPLTRELLAEADAFFLTNAVRGVQPISVFDNRSVNMKLYDPIFNESCLAEL